MIEIEYIKTDRAGTFSSSSAWKLTTNDKTGKGFGKPALTYIEEVQMEIELGRALTGADTGGKETTWGNLVEKRVFDLLPMDYLLESRTRFVHPTIKQWTGAPDLLTDIIVGDVKSPYTLKSFCNLVRVMEIGKGALEDEYPEYFWQLVSNSILTGRNTAELIVYVPYKSELSAIRELAIEQDIWIDKDENLPYLIEGKKYKNINKLQFQVTKADQDLLTIKVQEAVKLLKA